MMREFLKSMRRNWMATSLTIGILFVFSYYYTYYFIINRPIYKIRLNYDESLYSVSSFRYDTKVAYMPIFVTEITKPGESHLNWTSLITMTRYKRVNLSSLKEWVNGWIYELDLYKFNGKIIQNINEVGSYMINVEWVVNEGPDRQMQFTRFWYIDYDIYSVSYTEKPVISEPLEWKKSILGSYLYATWTFE